MNKTVHVNPFKSILLIVTGLLICSSLFQLTAFYYFAIGIAIICLLWTSGMNYILDIWGFIGRILGWINTRIILGIIFYFILFPISIFYKFRSNHMLKGNRISLFKIRNHLFTKEDLEHPW